MADIFISYSTNDRAEAAKLAALLEDRGYSVWWDRELAAGDQFHDVIRRVLQDCRLAIVIWTSSSIHSRWVLGEADIAAGADKLIPVRVDGLAQDQIPIGFRALHTLPTSNYGSLIEAVRSKLKTAPKTPSAWQLLELKMLRQRRQVSGWLSFRRVAMLLVAVLVVGYGAASTMEWLRIRDSLHPNDFQNYLKWAFLNPYARTARAKLTGREQWKSVASSADFSTLQRFVDEHPDSLYAPFARLRIKRIRAAVTGYTPILPESLSQTLDAKKLAALKCDSLWIARNEIYYRLGYCFTSDNANGVFHTDQDTECNYSCESINEIKLMVESIMSPIQLANVLAILQQEKERGCRVTPAVDACEKRP